MEENNLADTEDSEAVKDKKKPAEVKVLATLNRRLIAHILDGLVLGSFGAVLGLLFGNFFYGQPIIGRLIGFIITLIYFGIMDSAITGGRSLGKMVMKIEVVGKTGTSISVIRASIRAAVITLPFFLNNMSLPYDLAMNPVFMTVISIVIFGGMFTVLYFFTVNRATKQSIHDMITETYVVNSQSAIKTVEGKIQLYKYAILGILLIAIFHFGLNALNRLSQKMEMTEMTKLMQIISAKSDLYVTGIHENTTTVTGVINTENSKVNSLIVSGMPKEPKDNYNESAAKIVKIVRDNYNLNGIDKITIKFNVGYDIGISSSWKRVNISENVKK